MPILCWPRVAVKHGIKHAVKHTVHHTHHVRHLIPAAKIAGWTCLVVGATALQGAAVVGMAASGVRAVASVSVAVASGVGGIISPSAAPAVWPAVTASIPPVGFAPEFLLPSSNPVEWYLPSFPLPSAPMQLAFFGPPDFFPPTPSPTQPQPGQPGQPDTQAPELPPWMQKTVPERETRQPAPVPAPEPGSGIILATAIIAGAAVVTGKRL